MGLFSNRIDEASLKPGDHIYSWRAAYIYAHHGIYVGDNTVIHFTRNGQEVSLGTALDRLLASSMTVRHQAFCPTCSLLPIDGHGVISSCLDCFLAGGTLYRFEYSVSRSYFLVKFRSGTCTLAASDPGDMVISRAQKLLEKGFGVYDLLKNNCEDFAIYCKTGLVVVVVEQGATGLSGQAAVARGGQLESVFNILIDLAVTKNIYATAVTVVRTHCMNRYAADIINRRDAVKITVEDLTRSRSSKGLVEVIDPHMADSKPQADKSAA
ncbi:PREDICTED: uncharacterized protein LOC104809951 [Tarenaya hassleriana]|uniref:uncharacterized protein LOC104809951 n=1 Tax=Tarenaya hassleriana TaxID=28532 RepID=UPI00053CA9A1|nr:PREDICTED: uncharacterized protein LOC104809951 [Tarenaya hassleriana]